MLVQCFINRKSPRGTLTWVQSVHIPYKARLLGGNKRSEGQYFGLTHCPAYSIFTALQVPDSSRCPRGVLEMWSVPLYVALTSCEYKQKVKRSAVARLFFESFATFILFGW